MSYNQVLGKGLSILLKENIEVTTSNEDIVRNIDITLIAPCKYQPRKNFNDDRLYELANSIRINGILQPIIITKSDTDINKFMLIAGERRLRAARMIGYKTIPAIIKNIDVKNIIQLSIIENIQRESLTIIEESESLQSLIQEFNYSHNKVAELLGKSRSYITNLIRLNQLPVSVKNKINNNMLTIGHAKCLVGHKYAEEIADYIIQNNLSVRKTENIVKCWNNNKEEVLNSNKETTIDTNIDESNDLHLLSTLLSEKLGTKVIIEQLKVGGRLIFYYSDLETLDRIISKIE